MSLLGVSCGAFRGVEGRKEENVLFNNTLNTLYLRFYDKGPLR